MTGKQPKARPEPHWMVPIGVSALLALVLGWLGLNDWRFPWVETDPNGTDGEGQASPSATSAVAGATAPIVVDLLDGGAIDVRWSVVDEPTVHGYAVYVTAVRPLEYEYGVPR